AAGLPRAGHRGRHGGQARRRHVRRRAGRSRPAGRRQGAARIAEALGRRRAEGGPGRREHRRAVRRHAATDDLEGRMSTALQASGLGKRYGHTWALSDCTLEVPAGTVTALVGPNGAGKTTLLQLAIGLIAPTAGKLEVLGYSPTTEPGELLPRVGFVAQDHPLHR